MSEPEKRLKSELPGRRRTPGRAAEADERRNERAQEENPIRDLLTKQRTNWRKCFEIRFRQVSTVGEGLTIAACDPGRIGFSAKPAHNPFDVACRHSGIENLSKGINIKLKGRGDM